MRKLLIASIALLAIGATALTADLDGIWQGTGRGSCLTPTNITIYPWHAWAGTVGDGAFHGKWIDPNEQHGGFSGSVIAISPTTAFCDGEWSWVDESVVPPVVYVMGSFHMYFDYVGDTCWGAWWATGAVPQGGMTGYDTD